jgi:hypothetical protein
MNDHIARCAACPVPAGQPCRGEAVPRLCELAALDPARWAPRLTLTPDQLTRGHVDLVRAHTEPLLPPLGTMAGNALHAAWRAAGAAVAGEPVLAAPEVQAARLAVCGGAVGLTPDQTTDGHCDRWRPSDGRCSECGCYTNLARKLATKDCPLSRWPK